MNLMYGFIFAMFVLIALIGWWMELNITFKTRKSIYCQFCDKEMENGLWFKRDWCCFKCWDKYGLDDYIFEKPKRYSSWQRAEITIEEIQCDGKL